MTAPNKTSRPDQEASARLTVVYPDPSAVTIALGIPPDANWRAGDVRPGHSLPAKFGSWRLIENDNKISDGAWYAQHVEGCVRRLLARIDPAKFHRRLAALDSSPKPALVLTGFTYELPNIHLPSDLIQAIAALEADLEEDFYLLPTPDDENQER